MASGSTSGAGNSQFNKMIKDFKKALSERKTPGNLVFLNKIIAIILLITIALSSVDFGFKQIFVNNFEKESQLFVKTETRPTGLI